MMAGYLSRILAMNQLYLLTLMFSRGKNKQSCRNSSANLQMIVSGMLLDRLESSNKDYMMEIAQFTKVALLC